jgi:hypothetical protein
MRPVFFLGILSTDTLLPMELIAPALASTLVEGGWQAAPGFNKKLFYVPLWRRE